MYWNELRADNIGYNNQRYIFDYSKAGEHYLTVSWDQIPHLYSTSAQNIWNGVGTNNLDDLGQHSGQHAGPCGDWLDPGPRRDS